MKIIEIIFDKDTYALLKANGRMDRARGLSLEAGWQDLAKTMDFDPYARTPAREAYADGWYEVIK